MCKSILTANQIAGAKTHLAAPKMTAGRIMTHAEKVHYFMKKGGIPSIETTITDGRKSTQHVLVNSESDALLSHLSKIEYAYALSELFIDWTNNFLSLEKFAAFYHCSEDLALYWINQGRVENGVLFPAN